MARELIRIPVPEPVRSLSEANTVPESIKTVTVWLMENVVETMVERHTAARREGLNPMAWLLGWHAYASLLHIRDSVHQSVSRPARQLLRRGERCWLFADMPVYVSRTEHRCAVTVMCEPEEDLAFCLREAGKVIEP